jgi:hypothetical protein
MRDVKRLKRATIVVALAGLAALLAAQPTPMSNGLQMPAGFTPAPADVNSAAITAQMNQLGMGNGSGTKKNDYQGDAKKCFGNTLPAQAGITGGWSKLVVPGSYIQTLIQNQMNKPEDPAKGGQGAAVTDQPDGKLAYKGGVLFFRKITFNTIGEMGACANAKAVLYEAEWNIIRPGSDANTVRTANTSLTFFYGSKGEAQAAIGELIDQVLMRMGK